MINPSSADEPPSDSATERIAPPEGKSAAEVHAALEAGAERLLPSGRVRIPFVPLPPDPPLQFSLRDLLTVVTIVSVEFGGLHWLKPKESAGLAGLAALVWLICLTLLKLDSPLARLIWWALLIVYLMAAALTFVPPTI